MIIYIRRGLLIVLAIAIFGCSNANHGLPDGLYVILETSKGDITCSLAYEKTPVTVASFVSLAEGNNSFVAENFKGKPFYDGLTFHRVVKDFVIQGGDPLGDGSGGPGYNFTDEITDLSHDREGILSMANAGAGTNGSQFFITLAPQQFLDGKHTVFGYVVNGIDVVNQIAVGDSLSKVQILRVGEQAKKFNASAVFNRYVQQEKERKLAQEAALKQRQLDYDIKFKPLIEEQKKKFATMRLGAKKTKSGLQYILVKKGGQQKPKVGAIIQFNYAGYLEDGHLFDTNYESIAAKFGIFDTSKKEQNNYKPLSFEMGRQHGLIPGFAEALSYLSYGDKAVVFIPAALGYGPQGIPPMIPPHANLIFEIEIVKPTQ